MVLFAAGLFAIGICIGSFLNVLIDRLPNNENPLTGRSYCDKCKRTLKWDDLIPVISFILLKGKCRNCHSPISFYYPLVEVITGIMFVGVFLFVYGLQTTVYGSQFSILNSQFSIFLYYFFIVCSLLVVFFADIKYGIIPDAVVYPAVAVTLIYHLTFAIYHFSIINHPFLTLSSLAVSLPNLPNGSIFNSLLSGIGAFIFFLLLFLITRGKGMGFGDVKLAFLMGLFLGFPGIISALYVAFLTGAVIGLILIVWRKKKLSGGTIPFGPFLVFGALISLFFGEKIIQIIWNGAFLR